MNEKISPEALEVMKTRKLGEGARWAVYQNMALDSANCGHLQFLAVGPEQSHTTPPEQYPADTQAGLGWRYRFVGWADMASGEVVKL